MARNGLTASTEEFAQILFHLSQQLPASAPAAAPAVPATSAPRRPNY